MTTHKHTNKLITSTSPYLLQHAHNPVDWYPWGKEALERAIKEDKPILVSIGYSSCHWCHVMERESFENEDIAAIMNEHFICIKVDREERPDIDNIYMSAVQMMGGHGGWPLNVFLTPDLKPFYGGTYFPPEDRANMPGFPRVLNSIAESFKDKRDIIDENSTHIVDALTKSLQGPEGGVGLVGDDDFNGAVDTLRSQFDRTWGGFSGAPKFPANGSLDLLMRHYYRTGDKTVLDMITTTLDRMAHGGIYDHLGGGFHRYSVDGEWLVPHFEKMLYDNAQLADIYLKAYQITGDPMYRRIGQQTLDYVLRDMTDETGGFHSAEDADSEGEEGVFYVWSEAGINAVLGSEAGSLFRRYYGVTKTGNFEGHNILNMPTPFDEFAEKEKTDPAALLKRIDGMRIELLAARGSRERPRKDDKVLADWNGLMISALARGYQALGDEKYRHAANRAADFVLDRMTKAGRLQHSYRAGRSHIGAMLDDYAFMSQGLLDLYESTFDTKRIEQAVALADAMIETLWDKTRGGFYDTPAGLDDVLVRGKSAFDSAVPAGTAVAVHVLLRLSALTGNKGYLDKAERAMHLFNMAVGQYPSGFARLLSAYDFHRGPVKEVVIVGGRNEPSTVEMLALAHRVYLPNRVLVWTNPADADPEKLAKLIPTVEYKDRIEDKPAAYVCHGKVCYAPVTAVTELKKKLAEK